MGADTDPNRAAQELQRIRDAYVRRDAEGLSNRYGLTDRSNLFAAHQIERATIQLFRKHHILPLEEKKILDVGCGDGQILRRLLDFGASLDNLYGVDLLPDRVAKGQVLNPGLKLSCQDAREMSFPNGSFDLVIQFTVFTSILDLHVKRAVADEMLRVLKPGGTILWYDFLFDNPRNKDVKGVGKSEIRELFPSATISLHRVTLAPPLARRIVPASWTLGSLLERIPLLCTHFLGVIQKN